MTTPRNPLTANASEPRTTLETRFKAKALATVLIFVLTLGHPSPARAQFFFDLPVFDLSNFLQAVIQVSHLLQQYEWMLRQAERLPVDMNDRYRIFTPPWRPHDLDGFQYARPVLDALNLGDPGGTQYRQVVDLLDLPTDVLARMPLELQRRLGTAYATVELADSIATRGIDHAGTIRLHGTTLLDSLRSMEIDAFTTNDDFHTQTALLNKINTNGILGLRINAQSSQFLLDTVEQLLVDNKRKRDSEAKAINATIHHWRYGRDYGASLFDSTASNLDSWRQD